MTDAYAELSLGTLLAITPRGFTGHEHVDHAEVIHMNGRIYDPQTGRFMQADPIVQAPEHCQSPNRYSYVFNNPLSYTDPTGYEALIDFDNAMADWRPARGEQLYTTGRLSRPLSSNELKKLNKLAGTLGNQTPADFRL